MLPIATNPQRQMIKCRPLTRFPFKICRGPAGSSTVGLPLESLETLSQPSFNQTNRSPFGGPSTKMSFRRCPISAPFLYKEKIGNPMRGYKYLFPFCVALHSRLDENVDESGRHHRTQPPPPHENLPLPFYRRISKYGNCRHMSDALLHALTRGNADRHFEILR